MLIGLAGSHRTGKTTLARRFAEVTGYTNVETSTSAIFQRMGLDPQADYSIEKRLWIQLRILEELREIYTSNRTYAVVDRTPIDMAAYLMADVTRRQIDPYTDREIMAYVDSCLKLTNDHFSAVIVVQPGIATVEDITKAPAIESYMEHVNVVCLGLLSHHRLTRTLAYSLNRNCLDLDERCESLINIAADLPEPAHVIRFDQKLPM